MAEHALKAKVCCTTIIAHRNALRLAAHEAEHEGVTPLNVFVNGDRGEFHVILGYGIHDCTEIAGIRYPQSERLDLAFIVVEPVLVERGKARDRFHDGSDFPGVIKTCRHELVRRSVPASIRRGSDLWCLWAHSGTVTNKAYGTDRLQTK